VWYFSKPENALYPGWSVNVPTIHESFKFVIEQKNKEIKSESAKAEKKAERKSEKSSEKKTEKIPGAGAGSGSGSGKGSVRVSVSVSGSGSGSGKVPIKAKVPVKGKKVKLEQLLTRDLFHKFLPVLLLFKRFWDLFSAIDGLVVDDQKIFRGEFLRLKNRVEQVEVQEIKELQGIQILGDIPDDVWAAEFLQLDTKQNGFFTFDETIPYMMAHVKDSFSYDSEEEAEEEEEEEEVGESEKTAATSTSNSSYASDTSNTSNKTVDLATPAVAVVSTPPPKVGLKAQTSQKPWKLIEIVSHSYRTSSSCSKLPPGIGSGLATAAAASAGSTSDTTAAAATAAAAAADSCASEDRDTAALSQKTAAIVIAAAAATAAAATAAAASFAAFESFEDRGILSTHDHIGEEASPVNSFVMFV
jgi:uncharacterized membrane protein